MCVRVCVLRQCFAAFVQPRRCEPLLVAPRPPIVQAIRESPLAFSFQGIVCALFCGQATAGAPQQLLLLFPCALSSLHPSHGVQQQKAGTQRGSGSPGFPKLP